MPNEILIGLLKAAEIDALAQFERMLDYQSTFPSGCLHGFPSLITLERGGYNVDYITLDSEDMIDPRAKEGDSLCCMMYIEGWEFSGEYSFKLGDKAEQEWKESLDAHAKKRRQQIEEQRQVTEAQEKAEFKRLKEKFGNE